MRVAVVHHTLSSLGGGERVFVFTVRALNEVGVVPDVFATEVVGPDVVREWYGVDVEFVPHRVGSWFRVPGFGIYKRLLASYFSLGLGEDFDVVVNTTGVYSPVRVSRGSRYVLYVYNPFTVVVDDVEELPEYAIGLDEKYKSSWFWRLYFAPYRWLVKRSIARLKESNVVVLSVSECTRERVKRYWGIDSVVVYPPVDVEKFSEAFDGPHKEGVISIGRFTPEKRHLDQLEVARRNPDITFRLVGSANTPYYRHWFEVVRARAEELDLKNVEFYPSAPFKRLVELISESKLFIHTMRYEDFGLTPCEAVSGGVLPLVHDSGGGRETVPFKDQRFADVEEASKLVRYWHSMEPTAVRTRVKQHRDYVRQNFSAKLFMERMKWFILGDGYG